MSKDFKRKRASRYTKKTYLIICEGSCEEIYFKHLKHIERWTHVNIEVMNPRISTPVSIYKYARDMRRFRQYDTVFCIIDGDVLEGNGPSPGKGIHPVISIPCFELWLLLHFKYTSKDFYHCGELIERELKQYIPDYEKSTKYHNKKKFYELLRTNLDKAIRNAKKLEEENNKVLKIKGSSTQIYKLIEEILSGIKKEKGKD